MRFLTAFGMTAPLTPHRTASMNATAAHACGNNSINFAMPMVVARRFFNITAVVLRMRR